jgi:small conductance mechanosensitive channel
MIPFPVRGFLALAAVLMVLVTMAPAVYAQDAEDANPPKVTDVKDPAIGTGTLETMVKPLTQEELTELAATWQGLVKDKGVELAESRVAGDKDKVATQKGELSALVERFQIVVNALAAKGGDVEALNLYIGEVSEAPVGMEDIGDLESATRIGTMAFEWVKSPDGGLKWATKIILFLVTLIVFKILAGVLGKITAKAVGTLKKTSSLLKDFFVNVVKKIVFLIGIVVALSMLDVNIGPFVAAIGAVGFVVGFALQGTLANFASGIMILLYRPYDIGDFVEVSGVLGKVDAMSLVSTTLRTPDNQVVVIPNGSIWGGIITNITGSDTRRVDLVFGIGYSDDIEKAQEIMQGILDEHELVLKNPEPVIQVHELADSSVNFVCRPWVKTPDYWTVYWDVTRQVKQRFDAAGVSIPFPQQDVHMHQVT